MKRRLPSIIVVFMGLLLVGAGGANASNFLKTIQVDFNTVKRIIIENQDKTPPDDMKPFVYNGRTYVPLRYVADALGKSVEWNAATGTVYIDSTINNNKADSLFDDFSQPLSNNWDVSRAVKQWTNDQNGAYSPGYFNNGYLPLNLENIQMSSNFTIECDVSCPEISDNAGFYIHGVGVIYLGHHGDDHLYVYAEGGGLDQALAADMKSQDYGHLKAVVTGQTIDVYFNDNYLYSDIVDDPKGPGIGLYSSNSGYIKSFRLTMN